MSLDELVQSIPDDDSGLRSQLAHWISDWKRSEASVESLNGLVGKWHGNVWFKDSEAQNNFYRNWIQFKHDAIEGIHGMTMNERLYCFGLFELWDTSDEIARSNIRAKLMANA